MNNREIKFRAWDKCNHTFLSMPLVGIDFENDCINTYEIVQISDTEYKQVQNTCYTYDLMQYTGLKDKNGVEIYESDVVKAWHSKDEPHMYEIYFGGGSFNLEDIRNADENFGENGEEYFLYHGDVISETRWIEVIGNIYENPELLENTNE